MRKIREKIERKFQTKIKLEKIAAFWGKWENLEIFETIQGKIENNYRSFKIIWDSWELRGFGEKMRELRIFINLIEKFFIWKFERVWKKKLRES